MFMRRKKGFSLIEMLVVIAIIAVLVSIIIPTVGASQTKANAAANAANLRSVKGQLAVLMVNGQFEYNDASAPTRVTESLETRIDEATKSGNYILAGALGLIKWSIEEISEAISDTSAGVAINRMNNTYYAEDGYLTIGGVSYSAPASKSVSVDGLNLRKDTQMSVTFGENNIIVTYDGITSEIFAAIAENGDASSIDMSTMNHSFVDANDDDVCDYCNGQYNHGTWDSTMGDLDSALGNGHKCEDADNNCVCDDSTCMLATHDFSYNSKNCRKNCGTANPNYEEPETCITPDTLITLVDGSVKPVKDLTYSDRLIAWNHFTGAYQVTSASYIVKHDAREVNVITLYFSDGNYVEIVGEHGFYDVDLNRYVFINEENVNCFVGHGFAKQALSNYVVVTLDSYTVEAKEIESYSLASIACNNVMANNMFSLTPIEGLDSENFFNFIEMGDGLKYDDAALNEDMETYGLFTYEDFADYMTEEEFAGFMYSNGGYLKIAMEKGYVTFEQILAMLNPVDMIAK